MSGPVFFCFFNGTTPTAIYTLSLHDALPISEHDPVLGVVDRRLVGRLHESDRTGRRLQPPVRSDSRSEEHTSELQSHSELVCRLLLEKKKSRRRATRAVGTASSGTTSARSWS